MAYSETDWHATHRLTLADGECVDVALVGDERLGEMTGGGAPTRVEWELMVRPEFSRTDEGDWLRNGEPVEVSVERLPL